MTPHHLLLTDEDVYTSGLSTHFKMNPPLRSESDRLALIEGLRDGTVDAIASDHAPHHKDEKELQFSMAPMGIVGLETMLSLCLDRLVKAEVISLSRMVDLLSTSAARIMGLPGGTLAPGSPADVTLVDLGQVVEVKAESFKSKSSNTPFEGWKLKGAPVCTVCNGAVQRFD